MRFITLESLRGPAQPRLVADAEEPPRDEVSRRCANCGAVMPEDVGAWIVAADDHGVMLLCSRECDQQLEVTEVVDEL